MSPTLVACRSPDVGPTAFGVGCRFGVLLLLLLLVHLHARVHARCLHLACYCPLLFGRCNVHSERPTCGVDGARWRGRVGEAASAISMQAIYWLCTVQTFVRIEVAAGTSQQLRSPVTAGAPATRARSTAMGQLTGTARLRRPSCSCCLPRSASVTYAPSNSDHGRLRRNAVWCARRWRCVTCEHHAVCGDGSRSCRLYGSTAGLDSNPQQLAISNQQQPAATSNPCQQPA
jgi:hypothetical protein